MEEKLICYDFSNDIPVKVENKEDLQRILRTIEKTLINELNMKINGKKKGKSSRV